MILAHLHSWCWSLYSLAKICQNMGFACRAFQHSRLPKSLLLLRAKQKTSPMLHMHTSIASSCPDSTDLNSMEHLQDSKEVTSSELDDPTSQMILFPFIQRLWVCVSFVEHVEGSFPYKHLQSYSPFGVKVQGDLGSKSYSCYCNCDQITPRSFSI